MTKMHPRSEKDVNVSQARMYDLVKRPDAGSSEALSAVGESLAARLFPVVLGRLRHYPDLFLLVSIASGLIGAGIGSVIFGIPLALAAFPGSRRHQPHQCRRTQGDRAQSADDGA